jgi:hypothetical protein
MLPPIATLTMIENHSALMLSPSVDPPKPLNTGPGAEEHGNANRDRQQDRHGGRADAAGNSIELCVQAPGDNNTTPAPP